MRRIVGPGGGGQSLELPRASSRGGVNAKPGPTSQKTPLPVKMELSRREPMRTKRRGGAHACDLADGRQEFSR
jgi:hypothetical protein